MSALDCEPPGDAVRDAVARALAEDLGPSGDVTAALVSADSSMTGLLIARAGGVVAGTACATETYAQLDDRVAIEWKVRDGGRIDAGNAIAKVTGPTRAVLTGERTALNFLCHLSGIASMTRRFVDVAAGRLAILDTRKTLPGLRVLEKAAVRAGGGTNHRMSLSDMVLIKDNHLAGVGIVEAIHQARAMWPDHRIEVECEGFDHVQAAVAAGADVVMLDNMTPEAARARIDAVRASARPQTAVEISGGVTLETLEAYATIGADSCSTSVITQSAPALDIALDVVIT